MTRPRLTVLHPGDRPVPVPVPRPARVPLAAMRRLDVEQARKFLLSLDGRVAVAELPESMYLLGLLEGHAQALLDIIDTITEVG
ncbi:MAG: hypothetical protein ACR2MP_07215 [Streptosporangiaceae bacterium]